MLISEFLTRASACLIASSSVLNPKSKLNVFSVAFGSYFAYGASFSSSFSTGASGSSSWAVNS